jgi:hypothetical protein
MTLLQPDFPDLPASARVWIYGSERKLDADQIRALEDHMQQFLAEWHSHGREVTPRWQLVHDRFVMIGVDESAAMLSGCSIDSMVHALEDFSRRSGLMFSNSGGQVFYRDGTDAIHSVDRLAFTDLASRGEVGLRTIVFDNTLARLDEVRSGRWELPLEQSWHMQVFGKRLPGPTAPAGG